MFDKLNLTDNQQKNDKNADSEKVKCLIIVVLKIYLIRYLVNLV